MGLILNKILEAEVIWMSPPCTTFSMASGNTHWNADRSPKTKQGEEAKKILDYCWMVAQICIENNKIFFIENPRARARWFLPAEYRKTVWYCQYGDKRAKPTDIWTNLEDWNPKTCKNGNKECHHEPAPRGSKTGTQGVKGSRDRGIIPPKLFYEIFEVLKVKNRSKIRDSKVRIIKGKNHASIIRRKERYPKIRKYIGLDVLEVKNE